MEKRLTVLLHENGTVQIIPEDGSSNQQRWISGVFLLLEFCFGVSLGLVVLLGLRPKFCPKALIGLQITALLDCLQGEVLGAIFLTAIPTLPLCRLSACSSTTLLVIETIEVAILTFPPQNFLIDIMPWMVGLIVAFSIAVDHQQTPVNFFPSRNGCSVVNGGYSLFSTGMIMVFGSSWLGTATGLMHSAIWRVNSLDITVSRIITVLYIVLVLPLALVLLISLTSKPYSGSISNNSGNVGESVFVWARYQFNIVLPIIILIFYKEVRKQSENVLCWFRKNSVRQTPIRSNHSSQINISKRKITKLPNKIKSNLSTPVLFATSNGLHLRMVDDDSTESPSTSNEQSTIICEPCDLTESDMSISKATTICPLPVAPSECRKNVRFASPHVSEAPLLATPHVSEAPLFASPHVSEAPLAESGVWSSTEEADVLRLNLNRMSSQRELRNDLGVTYTKV